MNAATQADVFGKYELVQRLGMGGMAEVWKARAVGPQGFARTVVLKRVLPHLVRDPDFVKMFIAEARLSARLMHSNIVQVFELGETNGEYFLAMEYVRGSDLVAVLRARAQKGPLPVGAAAYVIREVCRALDYAHNLRDDEGRLLRLIHRDVSPSNVMIGFDGGVKLLDFGIAKALGERSDHRTATGTLKGKFGYMAPELVEGRPIDHRSDLFSAGIMLHEMLTQRRLFKGVSDMQTLALVRAAVVPPPSEHNDQVTPELDRITLKSLARDPDERFATCGELAMALDDVVHDLKWGPERMAAVMSELFGPTDSHSEPSASVAPAPTGTESIATVSSAPALATVSSAPALATVSSASAIAPPSAVGVGQPRTRGPSRKMVAAAAILSALVVGAWRVSSRPSKVAPVPSAPAVQVSAEHAPSAPVAPREVAFVLGSQPLGASVFIDGEATARGRTPLTVRLPRADGTRHVRLELAGYEPSSTDIAATADAQVQLALAKKRGREPRPEKKRQASASRRKPAGSEFDGTIADPFGGN